MEKINKFHDKHYKKLLLIPIIILLASLVYLGVFYKQNGDFMDKDISLTGGTSITLQGNFDAEKITNDLSGKLEDMNTREIYDIVTREQKALIIETKSDGEATKKVVEDYLGYELNKDNSSFEFTGSSLGQSFFKQLILAIIYAFTFMGIVVFFLFGEQKKIKILLVILGVLSPLLFFAFKILTIQTALILSIVVLVFTIGIYLRYNMPSFAVIVSAFADIIMTLALVNILGIKMSSAGIIAFLMLIGYSVDTDILLTNRILKKGEGSINEKIFRSFKTGITMTATSFFAFLIALIIVSSFSVILTQIFTILVIGLGFDIINTWITNVSLLKWHFGDKQ
jgi:preprotein translocase subunit SecF